VFYLSLAIKPSNLVFISSNHSTPFTFFFSADSIVFQDSLGYSHLIAAALVFSFLYELSAMSSSFVCICDKLPLIFLSNNRLSGSTHATFFLAIFFIWLGFNLIVLEYNFAPNSHIFSFTFPATAHTAGKAQPITAHHTSSQAVAFLCSDCGINIAVSTAHIVAHLATLLTNEPAFATVLATSHATIPIFHNQAGLAICAISQTVLLALYQKLSVSAHDVLDILLSSK
jgi:hypothetical protein